MKINVEVITNLKTKEVDQAVKSATKTAIKNTVVDIAHDAIQGSPKRTGNNMRSIQYEVGPGGKVATGELEGAVYGTSGYSGWLEVGTSRMSARPYFRPALDRNIGKLPEAIKAHLA